MTPSDGRFDFVNGINESIGEGKERISFPSLAPHRSRVPQSDLNASAPFLAFDFHGPIAG